jgi:dephospho-CoA kinase
MEEPGPATLINALSRARVAPARRLRATAAGPFDFRFNAGSLAACRRAMLHAKIQPMKVFGLTGGVGMGKSTSAQLLQSRGAVVVDTDELARQIVEPGQPALAEVREAFGQDIVGPDGQLQRGKLAGIVFADAAARRRLEAILHPPIRDLWHAQVETWRKEGKPLAVVVIPLLFETQAESEFDTVICVACSAATQHERLRARGWTPEQIEQRRAAQMPIEEKMARSHRVIWTEGDMDVHERQICRIVPPIR